MKIELKKYGDILLSRPSGREASLVFQSLYSGSTLAGILEIDFAGVHVLGPSWLDEFISGLPESLRSRIVFLPSDNPSVIETLKILDFKVEEEHNE